MECHKMHVLLALSNFATLSLFPSNTLVHITDDDASHGPNVTASWYMESYLTDIEVKRSNQREYWICGKKQQKIRPASGNSLWDMHISDAGKLRARRSVVNTLENSFPLYNVVTYKAPVNIIQFLVVDVPVLDLERQGRGAM